jgi:hypothetical protein
MPKFSGVLLASGRTLATPALGLAQTWASESTIEGP